MTEIVYGTVNTRPAEPVLPRWWRTVDRWSIAAIFALFGVGILLGFASSPPLAERHGYAPFHYVTRQAIFGTAGLVAMLVLSMFSPRDIRRLATLGFAVAMVAVMLLPVFGTDFGKGAVRWYSLGFASLQPSEFLKPGFVVLTAWLMASSTQIGGPPGKTLSFILTVIVVGFLALQPDFGQASLIIFAWLVVYFVAGAPITLLTALAASVLVAGIGAYQTSEHFARRIDGYLSADIDPTTQIGYATNAIQEGGFFGVGVGEGTVKWSLPDAHTDFIIAVAAEEYGLVMVLVVISLFLFVLLRSTFRLMRERDMFARLAGIGIVALFGAQAMINLGVAVRLLPSKGMTLPFVSYGGSSAIAMGIAMGLLLALSRTRPQVDMTELLGRGT